MKKNLDFEGWDLWDEFCARQDKKYKTPEEWVIVAEELAEEHDGTLPNTSWLQKNGYTALYRSMRKQPDLFKHIIQYKKYKTPEEWVIVAKQLAEEHGTLPNQWWLEKNKYAGLDQAMRKQPDLFKHIIQDKKIKTPEEWVLVAEELAEEHDRILPKPRWLQKNQYGGLYQAMKKHPDLFKHIKRDWFKKC